MRLLPDPKNVTFYGQRHMRSWPISNNDPFRLITLRHLRVIAALADLKLVARVSEAVNVTQPAVL